jgi:D-serine ammonia-lyase
MISLLVDNVDAFGNIEQAANSNGPDAMKSKRPRMGLFVKVDTGYHRAGVSPTSRESESLVTAIVSSEQKSSSIFLQGFYSHTSLSYGSTSPESALEYTISEIAGLETAVGFARDKCGVLPTRRLVLSFGATPSATAVQRLLDADPASEPIVAKVRNLIQSVSKSDDIELHAGVYTTLDLQQLASHARNSSVLNSSALALRILVEVASVYTDRDVSGTGAMEVLVTGGTLALGREPCKEYAGWGVVTGWNCEHSGERNEPTNPFAQEGGYWYVDRISQEHGILRWKGTTEGRRELKVGEKLLVWPNHACIASASYGYYVVVDSDGWDGGNEVVDVWIRASGW